MLRSSFIIGSIETQTGLDRDYCMECGTCIHNCSQGAITVKVGVGCVAAIINGALKNAEPNCGCSTQNKGCC